MKKLTKKTFVGLFALVLAVVALGTTTFAWFTIGNTVEVQDFELNVTGGEGLEVVYLDKEDTVVGNWSTILATDVLVKNIAKEYGVVSGSEGDPVEFKKQFKFDAVTSDDGLTFTKLELEPNVQLTSPIADLRKLESGVLEFKLRFRTIAKPTGDDPVKLQWNGVTLKSEPVTWTPDLPFTGVGGGTVSGAANYYASNGARISVNGNLSAPVVYESPSTATGNTVLSDKVPNWTQGAHNYLKVITGIDLATTQLAAYKAVQTVQEIDSTSANIKHVANFGDDVDDDGYRYADVTIRIYLEGFDADTFNAILTGKIQMALQFTFEQ